MFKRLLVGIVKGLVIGGAVGGAIYFGAHLAAFTGVLAYLAYGALGAITGALAGKAPWKQGAGIEAALRGVFGIAVGCGLYALAQAFLKVGPMPLPEVAPLVGAQPHSVADQAMFMAPALSMLYAALIELDNDGKGEDVAPAKVRVTRVEDIDVGEDEPEARSATPAAKTGKR